jgi:hypothetical protein
VRERRPWLPPADTALLRVQGDLLEHFEDLPNLLQVVLRLERRGRFTTLAQDLLDRRHDGEVLLSTAPSTLLPDLLAETLAELAHHVPVLHRELGLDLPIPRVDGRRILMRWLRLRRGSRASVRNPSLAKSAVARRLDGLAGAGE